MTVKKHISDNFALRFGVGGDIRDETGETSTGSGEMNYSQNRTYNFIATLNFQYFLSSGSKIKPFVSAGPYCEYLYNLSSSGAFKIEEWGAGIFASFGVEMFIIDNVSLIGEYIFKATAGKRYNKRFNTVYGPEGYSYTTVYKTTFKTARLGFSVYF